MPLISTRRTNTTILFHASILLLPSLARSAVADPGDNDYRGWIWETGVFGGVDLSEEFCFGQINLDFAGDLTWATDNTGTMRDRTNKHPT